MSANEMSVNQLQEDCGLNEAFDNQLPLKHDVMMS
jgi:hypothetical protein